MALDRADFANQVQQQQFGLPPTFWPIVIDPSSGAPGGQQMQLGQDYEIPINPCDAIWLPQMFDPSIYTGNYPYFQENYAGILQPALPECAVQIGQNVYDVYDAGDSGTWIQQAPIFSLRFNVPSAPWLLWSLSNIMANDVNPSLAGESGCYFGTSDSMRSISGPISRLWVKFLKFAYWQNQPNPAPTNDPLGSAVVLLSSLGYRQSTIGVAQRSSASSPVGTNGTTVPGVFPQAVTGLVNFGYESGGFVQTNVNSLDRAELDLRGHGRTVRPDGKP